VEKNGKEKNFIMINKICGEHLNGKNFFNRKEKEYN
jgi:hypothetical protein